MTTVRSTLAGAVAGLAMTGSALAATMPAENTSPYVMNLAGSEVVMSPTARVTGAPFSKTVANVQMAPHWDAEHGASCIVVGTPVKTGFTDADGNPTEPDRYQSAYVRANIVEAKTTDVAFQAGFPIAGDAELIVAGEAVDSKVGGTMPNGQDISDNMVQPNADGYVTMYQGLRDGVYVKVIATSQYGNILTSIYKTAVASEATEQCAAFLSNEQAIAELAEEASQVVKVETEMVSTDELIASGYETIEAQRAFKRSLLGQSCTARTFTDAEIDRVNVVRAKSITGMEPTSLYGVNYNGKTAFGDYYLEEDGTVKVSKSTLDPSITSCAGSVTATEGFNSFAEPFSKPDPFGGYSMPAPVVVGGNSFLGGGGFFSGGIIVREEEKITKVFEDCNCIEEKKPHDVAPIPIPAALPLLASGIAALGFASRRRRGGPA